MLLKCNRECLDHYFIVFGELRLRRILEGIRLPINAFERALPEQGCAEFPTCPTDRHSHASPGSRGAPRAYVCDRFFAVLPGPEPGGTELEAVVLRYQLPLPPLRQRPQLQIYARMPAQGA